MNCYVNRCENMPIFIVCASECIVTTHYIFCFKAMCQLKSTKINPDNSYCFEKSAAS
jgi:hypothetical protein